LKILIYDRASQGETQRKSLPDEITVSRNVHPTVSLRRNGIYFEYEGEAEQI